MVTRLAALSPVHLAPNLIRRPYRGGPRLAAFRRASASGAEHLPEDWIASATTVFGEAELGLSRLPDGRTVRAAVAAAPEAYLGLDHVAVFGPHPGVLVKLIDAGQRLAIHIHPDRGFARRHLATSYGKTEAWYVLAADPGAAVHVGFREEIGSDELLATVAAGEGARLLDRLHRLPVAAGDVVFVPAGTPHAIGQGIFVLEVQEPTDLLVRLEWAGYQVGALPSELGLGFPVALQAVDRSGWAPDRLAAVVRMASTGELIGDLLPPAADPFFRLERVRGSYDAGLGPALAILVVVAGEGELRPEFADPLALTAGDCVLVPWAVGATTVSGDLDVLRCRPADPAKAEVADPDLRSLARVAQPAGAAA